MNNKLRTTVPGGISADVVLGNPRRKCAGQGICRVTALMAENHCSCIKLRAFLRWEQEGRILSFSFPKAVIPCELYEIYFSHGTFELKARVKVGKEVLGSTEAWLKKGRYEVRTSSDFVEVQIACQAGPQAVMSKPYDKGIYTHTDPASAAEQAV